MKIREDVFLVYQVTRRFTGANIHKGLALVASYRNAVEFATDARCKDRKDARAFVARVETELRSFQ